jgi:single-strand DNA-binding protein
MNRVILIGRLTRDIEVKYTQSAEPMAVAKFSLAVDRGAKKEGQPTADFINCTAFGKTAENVSKFFAKGNKIAVVGSLRVESYKGQDGVNKTYVNVVVDSFDFCESRGNTSAPTEQKSYPRSEDTDTQSAPFFISDDVGDLPF